VLQVRGAASVGGDGQREEHDTRDEKFAGIKRGGLGGDAGNDADEKFIFIRHRQRHRERVIHAFAVQLLGENLIYCDGECATHSHSVRSVSSKIYTFFVLCFIFVAVV
jgi:hypothetical protein